MIPAREWAARYWRTDPTHVLTEADIIYLPPSGSPHPTYGPIPLGASGPFISWIMDSHAGVDAGIGFSGVPGLPFPVDPTNPLGERNPDILAYLQKARTELSTALRPYVGRPITQLPVSLAVNVMAPSTPTGMVDVVGPIIDGILGAVRELLAGLGGALGPLIVGTVVLVAVLVLIYMGAKRTLS